MKIDTISKADAQKWANALRSGNFKQGRKALQQDDRFCCLGVACKIFIPVKGQLIKNDQLIGLVPVHQDGAPSWLKVIDSDLEVRIDVSFTSLNDVSRHSFNEIADIIELVYVHKAL